MIAESDDDLKQDDLKQGNLEQLVQGFDENQRSQVAVFLRKAPGRRLALADSPLDRAFAVHDWLNAHGLPPVAEPESAPSERGTGTIRQLPAPSSLPSTTLQAALELRRSHYRHTRHPITLTELGNLLHHSLRIFHRERQGAGTPLPLSHAPSGGGLNPIGIHIAAQHVEDLDAGIYSYHRARHELKAVEIADPAPALRRAYGQAEFVDTAPITLLITAKLQESVARYGPRHYRTLHVDTGVVIQNLYLVATVLNLGGCAVSGFRDVSAKKLLGSGSGDIVTALFPVGRVRPPSSGSTR